MQLALDLDERAAVSRHRPTTPGPSAHRDEAAAPRPRAPEGEQRHGVDGDRPDGPAPDSWRLDEHTRAVGLAGVAAARALLEQHRPGGRAA